MSTYIIGDIQGCLQPLKRLLDVIHYDPSCDRIGFAGDLVNRGPESLATLRFIKSLDNPIIVLGNHDLHLLALGYGLIERDPDHCLQEIVNAPDSVELLDWLRQQPLLFQDPNFYVVHAGIPPQWSLEHAWQLSQEVSNALRGPDFKTFLAHMHGDEPQQWQEQLEGFDRLRYIVNALTRMRFCTSGGQLDLSNKTALNEKVDFQPWFHWRCNDPQPIIFGHWAALKGRCQQSNIHAIDTGCVWGGPLTAIRIEDRKLFQVDSA